MRTGNLAARIIPALAAVALSLLLVTATPGAEPNPATHPLDGARLVRIPAGAFRMGSEPEEIDTAWRRFNWPEEKKAQAAAEQPTHRVELNEFWIYRDEVTVEQYRRFTQATGRMMPDPPEWGWLDRHPIVNVNWEEASAYCAWVGGRLPTEAEWERSARGDATGLDGRPRHLFTWGDAAPQGQGGFGSLPDTALRDRLPDREAFPDYHDGHIFTAPVATFRPNSLGLHDMAGNVFEWCADWFARDYYRTSPEKNPTGAPQGYFRALRGGSWLSNPYGLRVAYRYYEFPGYRSYYVGFRPVLDRKPG